MFTSKCGACGFGARFDENQVPAAGLTSKCPNCNAPMRVMPPESDIIDLPAPKLREKPRDELPDLLTPVGPRSRRSELPDLLTPVGPTSSRGVPDLLTPVGPTSTKSGVPDLLTPVGPTSMRGVPDLMTPVGPNPTRGQDLQPVGPTSVRNAPQLPVPVGPTPRMNLPDLLTPVGPEPRAGTDLKPLGPSPIRNVPELPQPVGPEPTKGVDVPAPKGFFDEAPPPRPVSPKLPAPPQLDFDDLDEIPAGSVSEIPELEPLEEDEAPPNTTPPFAMDGLDLSPPQSGPPGGMETDQPYGEVDLPDDGTAGLVSFSAPAQPSVSTRPEPESGARTMPAPPPGGRFDLAAAPKPRGGTVAEDARATAVSRPGGAAGAEPRKRSRALLVAALGTVVAAAGAYYVYSSVELTVGNFQTAPAAERSEHITSLVDSVRKQMHDDQPGHWYRAIETAEQASMLEADPKTLVPKALMAQCYMAAALDEGLGFKEDHDKAEALVSELQKTGVKGVEIDKAVALRSILDPGKADEAYNQLENAGRRAPTDADIPLFQGWAALEAHDYNAALKSFAHAIELVPNRGPALYGLGRAQMALGDAAKAKESFQKLFDKHPTSKHYGAWLALTELNTTPRDPTGKRERELGVLCERAPEREKAHPRDRSRAWTLYGDEAMAANRFEAAAERYRTARDLDPRNLDALVGRATATIELRSLAAGTAGMTLTDARRDLDQALGTDPRHLGALLGMTRVSLLEGRPDEARKFVSTALEVAETNALVHYWEGKVLEDPALADLAAAERAYLRAVELAPRDYAAYVALSQLYLSRGAAAEKQGNKQEAKDFTAKAVQVLQPIADAARTDSHMANILGSAYLGAHDGPRAEEWFRTALAGDADYVDARLNLAATLEVAGRLDEAVAEYQRAHDKAPKREDVSLNLALALEKKKDYAGAEKIYQSLLSTAGGNVPTARAHAAAGRYWARRGHVDQARKEGDIVAAAEPGNPAAQFLQGLGMLADNKLNDAVNSIRSAVALDPQAQYYEALGRVYEEQKSLGEAQGAFEQSTKLDATYPPPLLGLGRIYLARREWDSALRVLDRAAHLEPENDQVWVGMGDAYVGLNKRAEAEDAYLKALSHDEKQGETHYKAGKVFFDDDKGAQAIQHLRRAIELAPGGSDWVANAYRLLGYRYYANRQQSEMCSAFKKYLDLSPSSDLMRDEVKRSVAGCP